MPCEPCIVGNHDQATLTQIRDVAARAVAAALLPDGHVGYVMPIGGVAAYADRVSVVGVGFDIACGNLALRTDRHRDDLPGDLGPLADAIVAAIPFGIGVPNRAADAPRDHPLFNDDPGWEALATVGAPVESLRARGRDGLGTVGGGNHYVDVFEDERRRIWIGVHFGSRGLGHAIASGFIALSQGGSWGQRAPEREVLLDVTSELGRAYWAAMTLAGRYAYAGRAWVAQKVLGVLGAQACETVHNHHNFAWREEHHGRELVVVRKGSTPAFPGQRGFVGGSMADDAVILRGAQGLTGDAALLQQALLASTVHGAGRVMGRRQALGQRDRRGRVVRPGRISREEMRGWVERAGVVVRGADVDEAPQAYRRLGDVLAACGPTIVVEHRLRPLIACMAPSGARDPYAD